LPAMVFIWLDKPVLPELAIFMSFEKVAFEFF
jgi:hypothetical protein